LRADPEIEVVEDGARYREQLKPARRRVADEVCEQNRFKNRLTVRTFSSSTKHSHAPCLPSAQNLISCGENQLFDIPFSTPRSPSSATRQLD
jgi:hypothetical protein